MKRVKAALTGVFAVAMATTGISAAAYGSPAAQRGPSASNPISVLYSYNYVFDSDAQANKWWASIAKQWAKADPSVKLTLLGTGGTDIDEMNKAAVLVPEPVADTLCDPTSHDLRRAVRRIGLLGATEQLCEGLARSGTACPRVFRR